VRRAALVLVALVLVAPVLSGCESNQEKSAALEKIDRPKEEEAAKRRALAQRALTITRQSSKVKVIATAVVHSSEGDAAVVTLRNASSTPLLDLPIQITVRNAQGASIYTNAIPGLSETLRSAALLPAHAVMTWIDDQVQATGTPASVSAKVGEGTPATGAIPRLSVEGAHLAAEQAGGAEAEGNIVNHSTVAQEELVVYALARRAGRIVAAGRAVLAQAPAGASSPFQIFFVGDPSGARLEVSAPATTPG
jgi:hypothetical protein